MNSKITTNPQLPTTEPKTQKQKLSKQLEQEQNHKNGHHMKGTGIRIIISRHEIDMQVQEAHRVPKKLDPRRNTPRHIIITLPKIKHKERILKAARKKETVTYKGSPMRL